MKKPRGFSIGTAILVLTVLTAFLLIGTFGANPFAAMGMFFYGIAGSPNSVVEVLVKATPLIFTGLAVAVAFKTGFLNLGAEGQFYMGAIMAAAVTLKLPGVPGLLRILLAFAAGFMAGGIWAFVASYLKARLKISEVITTIMLNYIAISIVGVLVRSVLQDTETYYAQSPKIDAGALFPKIAPPTRLNVGFFIAVLAAAAVYLLMERSAKGFELRVVGKNSRAAMCNGISVFKSTLFSAVLSGGLAALAGVVEVLGIHGRLMENISGSCGYTGILIALLAGNHPLGVIGAALGFAALDVGANTMQRQIGIPASIVSILMGLVVLLILGKDFIRTVLDMLKPTLGRKKEAH